MLSTTGWAPRAPARFPLAAAALLHLVLIGLWWAGTDRALPGPPPAEPGPLLLRWLELPLPDPPAHRGLAPTQPRPG